MTRDRLAALWLAQDVRQLHMVSRRPPADAEGLGPCAVSFDAARPAREADDWSEERGEVIQGR